MKQSFLIVLMTFLSISAYSRRGSSTELHAVLQLQPAVTSTNEVRSLLGKPAKTEQQKQQTAWTYHYGQTYIRLYWRSGRLEKINYANAERPLRAFKEKHLAHLQTGVSNLDDVVRRLGTPKNMLLSLNTQMVQYLFKDQVVNLYLQDGKLLRYEVNSTAKTLS